MVIGLAIPPAVKKCALILGMHRSGTSVISHAVETLGANLGHTLISSASDNSKGFFENKRIVNLNNELLTGLGCTWDSLNVPPIDEPYKEKVVSKICHTFTTAFGDADFYCIKDPRLIRLKEPWLDALNNMHIKPSFILANRHPFEVARSLQKRNSIPKRVALLLWITHQTSALSLVIQEGGMIIEYAEFLQNPRLKLEEIAQYLDIDVSKKQVEIDNFCCNFIDQKLRNNTFENKQGSLNEIEQLSLQLYRSINKLAEKKSGGTIKQALDTINLCAEYINTRKEEIKRIQEGFIEFKEALSYLINEHEKTIAINIAENKKLQSEIDWIQSRPIMLLKRRIAKWLGLKNHLL